MDNIGTTESLNEKIRTGDEEQYLTFQLGTEELGVSILSVKEIISFINITRVPMVPGYILGVINVRGNVVPVIDLGPRFGKKKSPITGLTCIIIVEIDDSESKHDIGIVVDSVEDVIDITEENMEAAPSFGANIRADYVAGIGKIGSRFIKLLHIDNVLDIGELSEFHMDLEQLHLNYIKRVSGRSNGDKAHATSEPHKIGSRNEIETAVANAEDEVAPVAIEEQ
ncbi:MAG: chemotaxis protein CheW [Leptospirales bacterium]